jgi:hypothetical protein
MFIPQARFDPSAPKPIAVLYTNATAYDIPSGTVVVANGKVQVVLGSGIRKAGSNDGPNTGSVGIGFAWFDFLCDASSFATPFTAVYWNATGTPVDQAGSAITALSSTGCLTTNPSGATFVGFTHPEQPAPLILGDGARARAWLQETGPVYVSSLAHLVADPGASGAIPVTLAGYCPLVTGGAETRTLAAPAFVGQELLLTAKTAVGNCVVTCATTVNAAGNNTITFSAAGQAVLLVAKANGSNIRWSVVSNDGAAVATV